jgi:hypothetical protein
LKYARAKPAPPVIPLKHLPLPHFPKQAVKLVEYKRFFLPFLDENRLTSLRFG